MKIRQKRLYENFLDACEAAIAVVLGVALVLSLVWSIEAAVAADVTATWDHDEVGPPETFNVERKLTSVTTPVWGALGTTPGNGSGFYSYFDADVPSGIFRYRVNAENPVGTSTWLESKLIMPVMTGNISSTATVAASSTFSAAYNPSNVIDGTFGDYDLDTPTTQWLPAIPVAGEWIQLDWASPVSVDKVMLSGRSVIARVVTDCTVTFSDTSSVPCGGALPAGGDPLVLEFPTKTDITWVRMTIDAGTDYSGLDEFIVIGQQFVVPSPPTNVQVTVQ